MVAAFPTLFLTLVNGDFFRMNPTWGSDPLVSVLGECPQVRKPLRGPFKGTSRGSVTFCLTQMAGIPSSFYSQSYWNLLFPGLGSPQMRPGPPFPSGEPLQLSLPVILHHLQVRVQPSSGLCSSYRLWCGSFTLSDEGVMISWTSRDSPCWLFYDLVVISVQSWEKTNPAFI